jgi:transcriptional regulator with XRE-family HTH domain
MQFNGPDKTLGARLMNAIAKKLNHKEKNQVTKEEIIAAIKAAIANNTLTLEEISQAVGMENKLKNATDEQRAKLVAAIAEALELPADTPTEELLKAAQAAFDEAEQAAESVVEAEAVNIANGKKIKNADGTEADNPAYIYARDKLKGRRGQALKNSIESLKKDTVMLSLRSKQADSRVTVSNAKTNGDDSGVDLEV